MANLEPCPFCGGEATVMESPDGFTSIGCANDGCPTEHMVFPLMFSFSTKEEAIEAWSTRYKRTCKWIPHKYNWENGRWLTECGQDLVSEDDVLPNFCPHCGGEVCGAEVVDGD